MRLRSVLFWLHLGAGLVAGLVIGLLCLTGATLGFKPQLVAWAERDVRRVTPPSAGATAQSLDELQQRVAARYPGTRPTAVTVTSDPQAAVVFSLGRDLQVFVNPYTGEVRTPVSRAMAQTMDLAEQGHRWLALGGDGRPVGKAITGASNLAFFFLAVSGLFLWWPRSWSWRGFRAVAVLNFRLAGRARDFNWHNAIGLWSAPILIVLTLTAVPMSYRWGANLILRLDGGAAGNAASRPPGSGEVRREAAALPPGTLERSLSAVRQQVAPWEQITLRAGAPIAARNHPEGSPGGSTITALVKTSNVWPRTAVTSVILAADTSIVLQLETPDQAPPSRRVRAWTRFLHTGEALGLGGQLIATLACLGGCILVFTGIALAWRRFFTPSSTSARQPS